MCQYGIPSRKFSPKSFVNIIDRRKMLSDIAKETILHTVIEGNDSI